MNDIKQFSKTEPASAKGTFEALVGIPLISQGEWGDHVSVGCMEVEERAVRSKLGQ